MSAAAWNPVVQWTPKHLVDEVTPPPRDSPSAWIVGLAPASTLYVIAGFDDDAELGETATTCAVGETMMFKPYREFNSIYVTVQPDGSWDTSDPIRAEADHFADENGDFIGGSVSEVISHFQSADERRNEVAEFRIHSYHWGNAKPFRLEISADTGKAHFNPVDAG
ncbi:hypothetical protein [Aureimonas phyllosphaerae]|uniref:Membrane carboxypeptidase/penicillin-binding protein n=1 Tax=Aureimonas phyllosphaerae TaxID=1166078 RepID=A0A7W6FW33_9HYPH|nr:hypothetical protein [Aureimonas phyllosphaerae]MBB3937904.1 membrane carboxypeptidase/penicillin-binding protein [Aureimonas phyllosphaerae]MBB3961923.1 membrane carboxypeptidase/penicillin-binding protein [Aureimonas phyllosphaerae]SFF54722.1 hypothetical protein SAMN05216566_12550 [Aureimonas phyllosphaerae]